MELSDLGSDMAFLSGGIIGRYPGFLTLLLGGVEPLDPELAGEFLAGRGMGAGGI